MNRRGWTARLRRATLALPVLLLAPSGCAKVEGITPGGTTGAAGAGLQYFPQIQPNVATTCSSNGNCGNFGPCDLYRTCFGLATTQIVLCGTNADCKAGETCIQLGQCPVSGGSCAPIGVYCPYGD